MHLHVKDAGGADTLDGERLAEVLRLVRQVSPGMPVGVTTGAWASPDPAERVRNVLGWTVLPDFASVNWHETGAEEVARALVERGVGVEAGLWHGEAVSVWLASPLRKHCCRVLIELRDGLDESETASEAERMLSAVTAGAPRVSVVVHGEGSSCWPAVRFAAQLGTATRIGLEDTLYMPDGSPAPDNRALAEAALAMLRHPPRRPHPIANGRPSTESR